MEISPNTEGWGSHSHLYIGLAIKEENEFQRQNRVVVIQTSKVKSSDHCGHDFRPAPVLLRTRNF